MKKKYIYLDKVNFPSDIKNFSNAELKILAEEVRTEMIDAVSETGGHLGAGPALHRASRPQKSGLRIHRKPSREMRSPVPAIDSE